jgi:hypothetical protein
MDPKFQTSFIPKKMPMIGSSVPTAPKGGSGTSIFMILAVLVFIISLAAAGGSYLYRDSVTAKQIVLKKQLSDRENQFNISLIEQLKATNVKIDAAKQLLTNHVAFSQIFAIISQLTIENVRFMSLDVGAPADIGATDGVKISMHGYGTSFTAVAFQSDVLGKLQQYGTVSFGFTATVKPSSLLYSKNFTPVATTTPASSLH